MCIRASGVADPHSSWTPKITNPRRGPRLPRARVVYFTDTSEPTPDNTLHRQFRVLPAQPVQLVTFALAERTVTLTGAGPD